MDPKNELIEVDEQQIGLDRTEITSKGQIHLPGHELEQDHGSVLPQKDYGPGDTEPRSSARRIIDSVKEHKHDAGVKIKKSLHIKKDSGAFESSKAELPVLAETAHPKYETRQGHKTPESGEQLLKEFVHHPYDTVKARIADHGNQQVANNLVEEIPHGHEVDIVQASTRVERAKTEHERLLAIQNLSELLKERQSTYVRWTLDKHVLKLKVMPHAIRKPRLAFVKKNAQGDIVTDWQAYSVHLLDYYAHCYGGQYIGYASDPPTPSQQALIPNIERFLVVTAPFQELALAIRGIYRWDVPTKTANYLIMYLFLWHMNLLLSGLFVAILYFVAKRRFDKPSMEKLRVEIKHREDVERTALSLTEFLEKFGEREWADEMLQRLGPWFMMQTNDLADVFECVLNFYEWRNPGRTLLLLCILVGATLIAALAPAWLLLKSATLGAGIAFFGLFPIAVNHLEYRHLVSISKRLLWNIPTHAEWAIKYIQAEGVRVRANVASSVHDNNSERPTQTRNRKSYGAYHIKSTGHIIVDLDSVQFVTTLQKVHFSLPYDQIQRLEKEDRILRKHLPTRLAADIRKDMKLVSETGEEWKLTDMDDRDEAFAQIVGLSRNKWQVVW